MTIKLTKAERLLQISVCFTMDVWNRLFNISMILRICRKVVKNQVINDVILSRKFLPLISQKGLVENLYERMKIPWHNILVELILNSSKVVFMTEGVDVIVTHLERNIYRTGVSTVLFWAIYHSSWSKGIAMRN